MAQLFWVSERVGFVWYLLSSSQILLDLLICSKLDFIVFLTFFLSFFVNSFMAGFFVTVKRRWDICITTCTKGLDLSQKIFKEAYGLRAEICKFVCTLQTFNTERQINHYKMEKGDLSLCKCKNVSFFFFVHLCFIFPHKQHLWQWNTIKIYYHKNPKNLDTCKIALILNILKVEV